MENRPRCRRKLVFQLNERAVFGTRDWREFALGWICGRTHLIRGNDWIWLSELESNASETPSKTWWWERPSVRHVIHSGSACFMGHKSPETISSRILIKLLTQPTPAQRQQIPGIPVPDNSCNSRICGTSPFQIMGGQAQLILSTEIKGQR